MKEKKAIKNIELSFNCPQNWDNMPLCAGGRFCSICQKVVYDFTNKSQNDYEKMYQKHNGQMCGRFQQAQLKPISALKKVAALMTLSLAATEANAQTGNVQTGMVIPRGLVGKVAISPERKLSQSKPGYYHLEQDYEFKGGEDAMRAFIKNNLKYPENAKKQKIQGTVYVAFAVETDGHLTDIKLKKGFDVACNTEAVRLVALMQRKWKAKNKDAKLSRRYSMLPITFSLE